MRQLKVAAWFNLQPEFIIFLLSFTLVSSCNAGVVPREEESYLRGTQGPYRGQVIDALTKEPIRGAIVVAVWIFDVFALVQTNEQFYDAVEVVSDDKGFFVIDVPEIEQRAPRTTQFPVFTIFKPGYRYYRGWFASPEKMAQRQMQPLLGTVSLDPIAGKDRRQRERNLGVLPGDVPEGKIPELMKAYVKELEAIRRER